MDTGLMRLDLLDNTGVRINYGKSHVPKPPYYRYCTTHLSPG